MSSFWTTHRISFDLSNEAIGKFEKIFERRLKIPDGDVINIILLYFIKACDEDKIDKELLKTSVVEYFKIRPKSRRVNRILEVLVNV